MSKETWVSQTFQTSEAGVSSAFEPELIPDNQLAWMKNGVIRGGKPHTRTPLRFRLTLPRGKLQGVGFFSIQNGMLVVSIGGNIYRIRVGTKTSGFSYEEIPLEWRNSATQDFAWMQETVGYLVIQDGQSNPIIYDGSVARRSDTAEGEVPLGRQMAYGNGRLWVAINEQELVAGDIKTRALGSELLFTETGYLSGGGALISPQKITGMGFVPSAGSSGYGQLIVGGKNATTTIRADITNRDLWASWPGFVQTVLLDTGIASHFSIAQVNQDLWWRDGQGGIRSLRSAMVDEASGPGNTPQSREVARITDFEDQKRLASVSAIQFNNRLLMTASPFINEYGATSFRDIISLDFSPISSNRSKTAPSYDGEWEGLEFTRLVAGEFNGKKRGFALTLDPDGYNRLWEFDDGINDDELQICTGTGLATMESPIPMVLEYPSRDFGTPNARKVLQRCDVYLAGIEGEVSLDVYWRSDNLVKWNQWQEEVTACAVMSDSSTASPHVWKNLAPQGRAQIKTFSIPQTTQPLTGYGNQTGFEHQIRIVVTGKARVDRVVVHASVATQEQFALRDNSSFAVCAEQDITGNEIVYDPVSAGCSMQVGTSSCSLTANLAPIYPGTWSLLNYPEDINPNDVVLENNGVSDNLSVEVPDFGNYTFRLSAGTRVVDYTHGFYPCLFDYELDTTGLDGSGIYMWVMTGESSRELIGAFSGYTPGEIINVSAKFLNPAVSNIPGTERKIFFTFSVQDGDNTYEVATTTSANDETGDFSQQVIGDIDAYPSLDGWEGGFSDCEVIVISDYVSDGNYARFTIEQRTIPIEPDELTGLQAWWDASQITGLNNGDKVSSFVDLVVGNSLTSSSPTRRPTYLTNIQNGLPGIRFNKATFESMFFEPASGPLTEQSVFMVARLRDSAFSISIFGVYRVFGSTGLGSTQSFYGINGTSDIDLTQYGTVGSPSTLYVDNVLSPTGAMSPLSAHIYEQRRATAASNLNGRRFALNCANSSYQTEAQNIDFYEGFIYNRILTDDERAGVLAYLSYKWGITI